jgi:hypothetical protein
VVDTKNTPSTARGVLRVTLNPNTGAFSGATSYIATTAGLDGNQPTATALGPDGKLYVGFLKSGNIKRIVNPDTGSTQTVESVGNTPQGHAARAFAFVGNDLYIASVDALSVIRDAVSASCSGGCNAVTIADGFAGLSHTGITSDGVSAVYFAVAGPQNQGASQIWRYTPSNGLFTFVSSGGADRNGANASNFSFAASKTNLLTLDSAGDLWIGDDPSNTDATGAGRLWTIGSAPLASLPAGSPIAGTNLPAILNVLTGPWLMGFTQSEFKPTFNANGTFTATVTANAGGVTTVSGTWTLTPPLAPQPFTNPQGQLTFTNSGGIVLFSATFLQTNADTLVAFQPWRGTMGTPLSGVLSKATP